MSVHRNRCGRGTDSNMSTGTSSFTWKCNSGGQTVNYSANRAPTCGSANNEH